MMLASSYRNSAALVALSFAALAAFTFGGVRQAGAKPLNVVTTTPDLAAIVRSLAGAGCIETERYYTWTCDDLKLTVLCKPGEDPHYVDPRPSFVNRLNEADVFIQNGLELEAGWVPTLVRTARNPRILPAGPTANISGFVDASVVVTPLQMPMVAVTGRLMGDIHPGGNPHFMLDPLEGLKAARLIRDALVRLRPKRAEVFERNFAALEKRIHEGLVGEALAAKYEAEKLALLYEHQKLVPFLESQGEAHLLGGWLGRMRPFHGAQVVDDHILWPYFARRFGIEVIGHLEPRPGLPPTTSHMKEIIEEMKEKGVTILLQAAYFDPRFANFIVEHAGARVVRMANQAGSRPGTDDYVDMIGYNVEQLAAALDAVPKR
jgi:ABC-type Zn uptake system ZnuABC Zn-binding protein ZnuA